MNTLISSFSSALVVALSVAMLASPSRLHAFGGPPGGPFGDGSYFPNDGTFSAVVRGTNLTGTLQFSTTSESGPVPSSVDQQTTTNENSVTTSTLETVALGGVGSTGISNIYYNGNSYTGNSQGAVNSRSAGMTITFQAQALGAGNGTYEVLKRYTNTEIEPGPPLIVTESQVFQPIRTVSYFDSKTLNGFANCKTSNAFPNQKFKGSGQVFAQGVNFSQGNSDPTLDSEGPMEVSVTGVRLSNIASNFNTVQITSPSVITTSIVTNP